MVEELEQKIRSLYEKQKMEEQVLAGEKGRGKKRPFRKLQLGKKYCMSNGDTIFLYLKYCDEFDEFRRWFEESQRQESFKEQKIIEKQELARRQESFQSELATFWEKHDKKETNNIFTIASQVWNEYVKQLKKDRKPLGILCRYNIEKAVREAVTNLKTGKVSRQPVSKEKKSILGCTIKTYEKRQFATAKCKTIHNAVNYYFENTKFKSDDDDLEKYIQKVTDEIYLVVFNACGGCKSISSISFQKDGGNVSIQGVAISDIFSNQSVLSKDLFFKQFYLSKIEKQLPYYFRQKAQSIPDTGVLNNHCVPYFMTEVKRFLYNEICKNLWTQVEYTDVFKRLSLQVLNLGFYSGRSLFWNKCKQCESGLQDISCYPLRIYAYLFGISGGSFTVLSKFAMMLAKIFMGKNYMSNSFVVIRTCNPEFVKSFLKDIFLFDTSPQLHLDMVNDIQDYMHPILRRPIGYNQKSGVVPNYALRPGSKNISYHYTQYSVSDLGSRENLNKFYEDAYMCHVLNVTDLTDFADDKKDQLEQLSRWEQIEYQHEIFGKYVYQPEGVYVFITDNDSAIPFEKAKIKYKQIDLGRGQLPKFYEKMTSFEKAVLVSKLIIWGYRQLGNNEVAETKESDSERLKKYFIEHCFEKVEVPEKAYETVVNDKGDVERILKHPDKAYSVQLTTINAAWNAFMERYGSNSKYKFNKEYFSFANDNAKSDSLRDYYMSQKGYDEDEVFKKGTKSCVVYGYTLRDKESVKKEGEMLKQNEALTSSNSSIEEFSKKLYEDVLSIKFDEFCY